MTEARIVDLTAFRAHGVKALARLRAQAERQTDPRAKARLQGKAEGVDLMLDYLDVQARTRDAIVIPRQEADPADSAVRTALTEYRRAMAEAEWQQFVALLEGRTAPDDGPLG